MLNMIAHTLPSQTKSQNQSQQYGLMKEGNVINIEAVSMDKGQTETGRPAMPTPFAPSIFQVTPVPPYTVMLNGTPSIRENTILSTAKLATRSKKKQKGGGNGLMMIAAMHLLLACGLIDLGMFLTIRFNHYGHIWPDSYAKLSISEYRLYRNQMLSIRMLYSPVTVVIGLMIFFPKIIYLLIIFSSKVSFYRAVIVDGGISFLALIYACITGSHAYIILRNISKIDLGDDSDIICYALRGTREKAPQELRDRCLLVAYKMFGGHTAELLALMSAFKQQFGDRIYVVSHTDKLSEQKIIEFEKSQGLGNFRMEQISRSREVKQSYITSIFTTFWACLESLILVWRISPDAVLCNGPGVCVPICFAAALFDLLRLRNIRLFYIESLCRVKKLSLTGQILYMSRITDIFFVHWEDLVRRYPRVVLISCRQ
uniref:UDP-N-acetylglucosamine transferase subunit ALG14 n=1 Tax=Elaeophora elaphi TaxID=1147741 RepID=A0A0R3RX05_9BILA